MPGDQLVAARDERRLKAAQGETGLLRRDQGGRGAVGEQQEAQHLRHILEILLQVQAAQLQIDHQDAGLPVGPDDLVGELQRVDRREAAHEADDGPLGAVRQAGRPHDLEIEAGRGEPRAARDDQVGDAVGFQRSDRLHGQVQRVRLIQRHAGGGGGEGPATVEAAGVQNLVAWPRSGLEDRVAVLDVRQRRHAVEQCPPVRVGDRVAAKLDEGGMDVMRRDGRADAVQPGLGHGRSLMVLPRCGGAGNLRQGDVAPGCWVKDAFAVGYIPMDGYFPRLSRILRKMQHSSASSV